MIKTTSLTPEEKAVIVDKSTEPAYTATNDEFLPKGTYLCRKCGIALFDCKDKFRSHTGWPSFERELGNTVTFKPTPNDLRTEVICNSCEAHLGHVFFGEEYTKLNTRYCINSLALDFVPYINVKNTEEAIVAAGCFWGVEHLFNKLDGVLKAEVGYTGGLVDYPTYEQVCNGDTGHVEAVRIVYDPKIINYTGLIQYFFEIHNFSQVNGQGPDLGEQYLSKIFYHTETQYKLADKVIQYLQNMGYKVSTQLHPATPFWKAEAYHQQYYNKNSGQPYCHIRKKLF